MIKRCSGAGKTCFVSFNAAVWQEPRVQENNDQLYHKILKKEESALQPQNWDDMYDKACLF